MIEQRSTEPKWTTEHKEKEQGERKTYGEKACAAFFVQNEHDCLGCITGVCINECWMHLFFCSFVFTLAQEN